MLGGGNKGNKLQVLCELSLLAGKAALLKTGTRNKTQNNTETRAWRSRKLWGIRNENLSVNASPCWGGVQEDRTGCKKNFILSLLSYCPELAILCHYFIPPDNLKHRFWVPRFQDTDYLFHLSSKGFRFHPASQEIIRSLKSINYICQQWRKQMVFLVLWWQW